MDELQGAQAINWGGKNVLYLNCSGDFPSVQNGKNSPGMMTHTCNSSYLRGRDQEDANLRPAWAKN
jgi:hypothetical protein